VSTDRDTTRIVRSWLDEGVTQLPDRVLDAVLDQVPATPQRRALWWPARRFPFMNSAMLRYGAVAAAVVVAALIGLQLLPGGNFGSGPEATPTPTPSPEVLAYSGTPQPLEPGTYAIPAGRVTPARLTFEVPEGWSVRYLGFVKHQDQPREIGLTTYIVTHVYTDTCAQEGEFELMPIGPSVDDLVTALQGLGGAEVSPPVDTTVDGYPAKRVDISMPPDIDLASCRVPALQIWANEAETDFFARIPGASDSIYAVDVDGQTLVIVTGHLPGASASDVAEVDAILASVQIEP
jgi:hypothetical protein